MTEFAKLFKSEQYGQICVLQLQNEKYCPEVRFFVCLQGVCGISMAISYDDSPKGWQARDDFFTRVDLQQAEIYVAKAVGHCEAELGVTTTQPPM